MCADELKNRVSEEPGGTKVKILLVDDVELFLELEKTFFRREEVDLLVALNGEDALEILRKEQPDLVFLDLYMPGINGDAVCRQVREDQQLRNVPVVMVLQAGSEEDEQRCRQAGCNEILYKPVRRDAFIAAAARNLPVSQRAYPRIDASLKITFGLQPSKSLDNFTVNLSAGGLFIATGAILTVGTELNLEFQLPGEELDISCTGRVAWVNHPDWIKKPKLPVGMGVEFVNASPEHIELLHLFVDQQLSSSSLI